MTERPDNTRIHEWLDETVGPTPDPVEGTRQVMSQVQEISQAGRWLPFSLLGRKAHTSASTPSTTDTAEYQPSPILATNGRTPTVIGRTSSMLSPVKTITAGAIVFAIGSAFLIAQPFERQASVPGAATDMAPATFTIQRSGEPSVTTLNSGATMAVGPVESSDQRASGTHTVVSAGTMVEVADGDGGRIASDAVEIVNDGGSWVGSNRGFLTFPSDGPETVQFLGELVGEGGYEGLTMFLAETGDGENHRWLGVIVPTDDIPAVPDLPGE